MKLLLVFNLLLCSYLLFGKIHIMSPNQVSSFASLTNIKEHDTLQFPAGIYKIHNWSIDKPVTLIGEENAIIESKKGEQIFTILAENVHILSLHFKGVKTNYLKEFSAIRVEKGNQFTIKNNRFTNCYYAIYLANSMNGEILNNTILGDAKEEANSGNGIHAWYCKKLKIQGNKVEKQRDGIYFEFVDSSEIIENISYNNLRYGLHFMFSNNDRYHNNTFEHNGAGVAVMFSRRIEMYNNNFIFNWGNSSYGLLLKEIYDAEIYENMFMDNTTGIFVEGSNRVEYKKNEFIRNGWAIKFSGGCDSNVISENNFIDNTMDMMVSSKLLSNEISGNYWSAYNGYDLDKNGVGDVPYYPVKLYNYILAQVPESVILLRSLFVDILNYAEKVSPVFTPKDVYDSSPEMERITI